VSWLPIQHDAGCPQIDVVFFVANTALRIKRKFDYMQHLLLQNLFGHFSSSFWLTAFIKFINGILFEPEA